MEKYTEEEIKLLDQFAGQAMHSFLLFDTQPFDMITSNSYKAAKPMLKERKEVLKDEQDN